MWPLRKNLKDTHYTHIAGANSLHQKVLWGKTVTGKHRYSKVSHRSKVRKGKKKEQGRDGYDLPQEHPLHTSPQTRTSFLIPASCYYNVLNIVYHQTPAHSQGWKWTAEAATPKPRSQPNSGKGLLWAGFYPCTLGEQTFRKRTRVRTSFKTLISRALR